MLTERMIRKILESLEHTGYSMSDFSYENYEENFLLYYNNWTNYYFSIDDYKRMDNDLLVDLTIAPGVLSVEKAETHSDVLLSSTDFVDLVNAWVEATMEEESARIKNEQLKEQQEFFQKTEDYLKNKGLTNRYFNEEEKEEIDSKKTTFLNNVESALNSLSTEVETLKRRQDELELIVQKNEVNKNTMKSRDYILNVLKDIAIFIYKYPTTKSIGIWLLSCLLPESFQDIISNVPSIYAELDIDVDAEINQIPEEVNSSDK